jgi:hypothetical protein
MQKIEIRVRCNKALTESYCFLQLHRRRFSLLYRLHWPISVMVRGLMRALNMAVADKVLKEDEEEGGEVRVDHL